MYTQGWKVKKAFRSACPLAKKFPKYGWHKNFGYGTSKHLYGLKKYGITPHHRKKFKPVHNILINATRETP